MRPADPGETLVRSRPSGRIGESYECFADRDLTRAVLERMFAGVFTRRFAGVGEPVGEDLEQSAWSNGKSSGSEMFIDRTRTGLERIDGPAADDVRLAVMMLAGSNSPIARTSSRSGSRPRA